jgi:hypothetical protein
VVYGCESLKYRSDALGKTNLFAEHANMDLVNGLQLIAAIFALAAVIVQITQ